MTAVEDRLAEIRPTWHRGMYGCQQDMYDAATVLPLTAALRAVLTYADRCDVVGRAGLASDALKVTHRQVAEELRDLIAAALVVKP